MTVRGGLLERDGVIEAVAGLVSAVAAGQGGALFVAGEAGLGKTAVLEYGRGQADAAGLKPGFGRGHPMEGALPFGVLVQRPGRVRHAPHRATGSTAVRTATGPHHLN